MNREGQMSGVCVCVCVLLTTKEISSSLYRPIISINLGVNRSKASRDDEQ